MPVFEKSNAAYWFGRFQLDPDSGVLSRDGQPIQLTPKAFNTLLYLLDRSGKLVTKDELMKALWPDAYVAESNLTQTVFMLRKALADTESTESYIKTVPGRGYRFAAEVHRISPAATDSATSSAIVGQNAIAIPRDLSSSGPSLPPIARTRLQSRIRSGMALAGILLLSIAFKLALGRWVIPRQASAQNRKMIAVLPFENLTGDTGQDYFSDGFTEEMITQLGNLDPQHLGVIARTSVEHYRKGLVSAGQVGRELGVGYIVEGSVRRSGDRVRITTQLIRANDQTHLWAREYDRETKDLLELQREIARRVADEIQLMLDPARSATRGFSDANSYEAYDLYLKGRYFWAKRTPEGLGKAVGLFKAATKKDPGYSLAYAGLADSYAMMSGYGLAPARDYMPKASAAARQALQIDDSVAEAHTSLAVIAENYDYDWPTAEKEFRRALDLDPNYATAHQWYAEFLAFQGRFDEALEESERARQLDPLSLVIAADNGAILYFSRQYDRAIERFRSVLAMDPSVTRAHLLIAAYVQKGQFNDALADIELWRRTSGDAPWIWAWEAYVYGRVPDAPKAREALKRLGQLDNSWHLEPDQFLDVAYAGTADHEKWLGWLETAYRNHSNVITDLKVDPMYDPLRSDLHFKDLLHRLGLDR